MPPLALENVALWHERDLTHSSVERVIIPDSCILLDYMLEKFTSIVEGPGGIRGQYGAQHRNDTRTGIFPNKYCWLWWSRSVTGKAYSLVQGNAMRCWQEKIPFKELLLADETIMSLINQNELDKIFDYGIYTANVDYIFKRSGLS
jgi:adenylosuccinate lyase